MNLDDLPEHLQDRVREEAERRGYDVGDDDYRGSRAWASAIELGDPEPYTDPSAPVPGETIEQRAERLQRAVDGLKDVNEFLRTSVLRTAPLLAQHEIDEKHSRARCGYHPQIIVSLTSDSVRCSVCGEEIPPLDVLREYARQERRFVSNIDQLNLQKTKLTQEVAALEKMRAKHRSALHAKGINPDTGRSKADDARLVASVKPPRRP